MSHNRFHLGPRAERQLRTMIEERHEAIGLANRVAADAGKTAAILSPDIRWLFWLVLEMKCHANRDVDQEEPNGE